MISLDDLRFFGVLAEGRSLAQAARSLDVTPPAVSQRLSALERRLASAWSNVSAAASS